MAIDPGENLATAPKRPMRTPTASDYFRIFTYATKWDFCIYGIASLASIGAGITMPLMNIIFGQLVGQFTDYSGTGSSDTNFSQILDRQALYIVALFIARWVLGSINRFCFRMLGISLSSAIRRHYMEALFAQPIKFIDSMAPGAPATAITTTSNTLQLGISERLGTFLESLVTIIAALIIAFVWSWDLTLVTSTLMLYVTAVISVCLPQIVKCQTAMTQADAEATSIVSEALAGIRLVMACNAQGRILSRYAKWVQNSRKQGRRMAPILGHQIGLIVSAPYPFDNKLTGI